MQSHKSLTLTFWLMLFCLPAAAEPTSAMPQNWQLQTQAGHTISWDELKGRPLILHFWATWCPYCKKLQPGLDALHQKYQAAGLQLMAVSFREDPGSKPQDVLANRGYQFTTLIDGEPLAELLGITGTPTTLFVHANGDILGVTRSSDPNAPGLEKAVKRLIEAYQP